MTRSEYINALRKKLKFRFTETELEDVVSDMEEFFEAGIAEGKTESQIICKLGDPETATETLIAEGGNDARRIILKEYILPVSACLLICGAFILIANSVQELLLFSFIIPLLMWAVLERKNYISSLVKRKADGFMLGAAFALIIAMTLFGGLPLGLKRIDRGTFVIIPLINVFMHVFSVLAVVSVVKCTKKLFCIIPIMLAAASSVNNISLFSCTATIDKTLELNPYLYKYYARYIYIFMAAVLFVIVLSTVKKNSFTIPISFLALFSLFALTEWYRYLTRIDPTNIIRGDLSGGKPYLLYGMISAAVTTVCIIALKLTSKRSVTADG